MKNRKAKRKRDSEKTIERNMKMKKIIAAIIALFVVFAVALGVESSFSKEKIEFVGEAKTIEYYFEKMYFYNSLQDEFDATANLLDTNTRIVALDENEKIQFKLPHKPLRVYELAANEKGSKIKVKYDKASKLYTLSDLPSSEVSEYDIVADYGLIKNIYCFMIYNKTYIEKNRKQKLAAELTKSAYDISKSSEKIIVKTNGTNYQDDTLTFEFSIKNNEKKAIKCSYFKLEKRIGDNWYSVDENDLSYNAEVYEKFKQEAEGTVKTNESKTIKITMSLCARFDLDALDGVSSGTYRITVPFTCENKNGYSISNSFTVGYVG